MNLLWALLFIVGGVFVEIAGMIVVGSHLGVLPTLLLLGGSMVAGFVLLRYFGKDYISRAQQELEQGSIPERAIIDGSIHFIACLLLIIPGFVSDLVACLLFVPPIRSLLWHILSKRMVVRAYPNHHKKKKREREHLTIDLEAQDYQSRDPENSPWRRFDDEKNNK